MRNIYNTNDPRNVIYQHKPTLYTCYIFPSWFILSIILTYFSITRGTIVTWDDGHYILSVITIFVLLMNFIYFFIAMHSICYVIAYELQKRPQVKTEKRLLNMPNPTHQQWSKVLPTHHNIPKVALIYCTYNDFLPDCLYQCFKYQNYPKLDVKILDDSSTLKYRRQVNQFAKLHSRQVQVIRRKKHRWDRNKAGNLNHGLRVIRNQHYDFYVFLDSDEKLEPDFVSKMLKEFYYGDKFGYHIGLIQATHHSGRNVNLFMKIGALSAKYFWNVQNTVRSSEAGIRHYCHKHTFVKGGAVMSNLGHGCMADVRAIYQSKLFPNLVSEDVANTMSMIHYGWNVYFSTQIIGNEETIISMKAMRTRSSKFAAGNLQWIKYYWKKILNSSMLSHTQKVDAYMLMCTANIGSFLYITVPICSVVFPVGHGMIGTSLIFLFPCIIIMYSSSIIDTCFSLANHMSLLNVIIREILVMAMYSSTYYLGVKVVFEDLLLHRKAKFNVTPKSIDKISIIQAIYNNLPEIIFSLITILYVLYFSGISGWMVLLAYVPPLLAPFAELSENKQSKSDKTYETYFKKHCIEALKFTTVPVDNVWTDWKA